MKQPLSLVIKQYESFIKISLCSLVAHCVNQSYCSKLFEQFLDSILLLGVMILLELRFMTNRQENGEP